LKYFSNGLIVGKFLYQEKQIEMVKTSVSIFNLKRFATIDIGAPTAKLLSVEKEKIFYKGRILLFL
jgi:hypothetical protein